MHRTEVIKLIGFCSVNYRNFPEPGKEEALTALWVEMLQDVDFEIAKLAVQKYMLESVYPPTIADIRARVSEFVGGYTPTAIEAWGEVKNSIRRYGYYAQEKGVKVLSPLTRKVIDSIGYRELCLSENEVADRAHFLKVYETMAKRDKEDSLMLPQMRALIQGRQAKPLMLEGEV